MSADPAPWRRQSSQISGNGISSPSPGPPPGAPPPPPPPCGAGTIPTVRIPTEMSHRKEPPAAIQNAMMTKDKKPFTYTPGGLDLNEIRSPRMAKRLSRNAHLEDSCTGAATAPPAPHVNPQQLPPQTLAAMQPQIAVAVLPPGAILPKAQNSPPISQGAPPPPPLPTNNGATPTQASFNNGISSAPPLPNHGPPVPPPMPSSGGPPLPPPLPMDGSLPSKQIPSEVIPGGFGAQSDTLRRNQPRPDYIADIANHAHTLKRVNQPPRSHADPQSQNFPPVQLRQTGFHPKSTQNNDESIPAADELDQAEFVRNKTPSPPRTVSNGGAPSSLEQHINQVKAPTPQTPPFRPNFQPPTQQAPRPGPPTPVQSPAVGNYPKPFRPQMSPVTPSTGEIQRQKFSPPRMSPPRDVVKVQPPVHSPPPPPPPQVTVSNQQRGSLHSAPSGDAIGPIYNQTRGSPPREVVTVFQPQVFQDMGAPRSNDRFQGKRPPGLKMPEDIDQQSRATPPSSASLRQAPAPWLTSQRPQAKDMPTWASREDAAPSFRSPPPNHIQTNTRIVPMQMESYHQETKQSSSTTTQQSRIHIIPIRLEGSDDVIKPQSSQPNKYDRPDNGQMYQQPMMHHQMPPTPTQMMHQRPQTPSHHLPQMPQTPSHHHLPQMPPTPSHNLPQMPGMAHQLPMTPKTPRGWSPVNSPPVQSRSFRVLQKITASDQEAFVDIAKSDEDVIFLLNRVQPKKEAPVYTEMMSPPVYTMPSSYQPQFYNMRSPTYDSNAGQQDVGSGNYWVWDANSQTYVANCNPSNIPSKPGTPSPGSDPGWQWDDGSVPRPAPHDGMYSPSYDYWNYPPQNEEEQRQFWEHYGHMCAYLAQLNAAACRYSPYPCPMPYQSDSEECGYSSNDEMTYYGQMFKQRAQNYWQNNRPQSAPESSDSTPKASDDTADEKEEDSDSTDTETENAVKIEEPKTESDGSDGSDDEMPHQLSVIYEETEPQSEADSRISIQPSDDEDSSVTLENESRKTSADNTSSDTESSIVRVRLPLKLKFSPSDDDCHVATLIVGDSEMESSPEITSEEIWSPSPERNPRESPQRNGWFTKSDVRESSVSPSKRWSSTKSDSKEFSPSIVPPSDGWSVSASDIRESSPSPDVTVTISLAKKKKPTPQKVEDDDTTIPSEFSDINTNEEIEDSAIDFWKEIKGSEDDEVPSRRSVSPSDTQTSKWDLSSREGSIQRIEEDSSESESSEEESESESSDEEEVEVGQETDRKINSSVSNVNTLDCEANSSSEDDESDSSECSRENPVRRCSESSVDPKKCNSVRRNMDLIMFKTSLDNDNSREGDESDNDGSSDTDDSSCANLSYTDGPADDRSAERLKERSVEESEEDDSGVTSDLSRHISETDTDVECGSELSKMTRYQRAATHSRLFKLLQDECSEQTESEEVTTVNKRERLTLPLLGNMSKSNISSDQESSSSGINSPMSPAINERLVKELVQSLLSRKKGRHFRKLPLEKLYAAAARILQEDMDYDTGSTSDDSNMFLSPCDNPRLEQPPGYQLPNPENYGENYYNYCDYYSSWADAAYYSSPQGYDIVPSNAFKALRETTESEKNRRDFAVPVRCPKLSLPKCILKEPKPDTAPPET